MPTLEPFHCSDRGCKFNLVLKCSEDFTLTHFYISGPGPRCTEPIRSGLVWVCSELPQDFEVTSAYDDLRPDELESHQSVDEERRGWNDASSAFDPPCVRFQTDVESREAEVELPRWQEGRYVIVRFLDTHFAEEQVNVDVGMIALVGHFGHCGRHQVPVGPWMRRRVQQAWVHARPLLRTFSSGGWVCDGRDFTGGCRGSFTDFHQTTMYTSRFHCSVTGFDLCEACAHDNSLGKVTDAAVQADIEALQNASTCKLVGTRLRNLWKRNWLHAVPRYFRHGLLQRVMTSLQSCLDHLTQSGRARALLEEEVASGRGRGRLVGTVLHPDPQQSAALRALLQLVSDLVHSILVRVRPGCDIQVNDLAWAPVAGPASDGHGPSCRWERCRVISLPPNFPAVNPSSACPNLDEDDEMDTGVASASFLVSSRDWKGKRQVQAENLWKVTKQLNDEDVVITTAGLLTEVLRGVQCDVNEVRRLVCHSADLSAANAEGQTALLGAAKSGCSYQVFTLLLEARACPDQSDRSGQTALQLLQKTISLGSSVDEVANAEHCTQLLRRHGAEQRAASEPDGLLKMMASLEEGLATEVLGPLLALRGTSSALGGFRPPPQEAMETALLLIRSLPMPALSRALFKSQDSNNGVDFLNGFLSRAIEGTSGATAALYGLRIARALKARALEEPRLLTTLCRHGVHRWAKRLVTTRDPQQAGCFGPALQEKAVPNEDLLREATSLCEELASLASVGPMMNPRSLSGVVRLLDQASAVGSDARAMKQAFQAVRDLLFEAGCDKCTAFELESSNFAGRLLRLLQGGSAQLHKDRWGIFEDIFQLREPKASKAMQCLLEALQSMIRTAECFPTWRYKRDRGLKALTEPVQLRLEHWHRTSKEPPHRSRESRDVVSVMVEPLVSLSEILRYLLRVTPIVSEEYLTFCHSLVGCSLRDASGEVVKVLSFELLVTDCPVPIHTVQCAAGERQRLLLALRDYEYAASEGRQAQAAQFKAALSALHAVGGSHQYAKLLDEVDEHLRTGKTEASEESTDRKVQRSSPARGRRPCLSDSEEEEAGTTSSSSSGAEARRRGKRGVEASAKAKSLAGLAGEAFKRAVQAAQACDDAFDVLHAERQRVAQAMLSLSAGEAAGMSSVDPSFRVHSVTLAVPEEIPLDVFWPMVQEDIMGAVQEFYPRGVPPQVQEVLQTGTPKDGAIHVAQRLTLEEAEMLAARLAHLSQTAVAVDLGAVQELKRLRRQSGESEDSRDVRWAQFTPRQGRQAAPPTAPAVAARVRLRSSPDGSDWISGVVVGHGPPNAPWRCSSGRQSSVEALLDIVDDQGLLWEQLPPTQVKLPAVQKSSGGTTSIPHGVENRPFLETRRLPPPPPVAREAAPAQRRESREEVPFLQPLELPQPPPPPLQPFIPVASAPVDEVMVQQPEHEEPPTPVLAVQEPEMQIEEETPRHSRHRRRSRSRSGSRSRSRSRTSRTRSRKASENVAHRRLAASRFESSSEASGPSHEEGHSRGRRAADSVDFDKVIGASPMLEISRIAASFRANEESEANKSQAANTPRSRAAKGVLADVLRGELPSFARAADSQDPTTLLGHPVALRLGREDLQEDKEAAEGKETWIPPPKFQVRLGLLRKESRKEMPLADLAAPALPADWSLLKTMQFLHDHQSASVEGKFQEEKKPHSCHAVPRRAAEKVPLENWHVGYFLETTDAEPAAGDDLAATSFDMDSFALPPLADADASTASAASERSLSMLPPLSLPSTPVTAITASPGRSPAPSLPLAPQSPWMSPRQSPAGPSAKRLRRASSQTFVEGSPSFVARDLYQSPNLQPCEDGGAAVKGAAPTEIRRLLRQCIGQRAGADEEVLDAFELLSVLWEREQATDLTWVNSKLDWKLSHQLEDPLSVSSGALPLWATTLPRACPFLFSLQTRKMLLRYTALGPSLAVHWAQESKVGPYLRRRNSLPTELGAATQGDPRKVEELLQEVSNIEDHVVRSDFWLGALQSTLLRLQRNSGRPDSLCDVSGERSSEDLADELLLQQAEAAMERIAPSDRLLEVQFDTETGFGSAVTRSFYAEVARALQNRATNRKVPMWVEDDANGSGHSSGSGGGSSQHLRCRSGLWVRPLPPSSSASGEAERRFRFLGRLVGRALKDGFIVPLPLGEAFFARTLLGQKPAKLHESNRREPLTALPRPGAGCAGELCGALADFVAVLKSGEELHCREREQAGLSRPSAEELQSWRRSQSRERDFTARFLMAGATPEPMSFEEYTSLVGVSFLETGLSGAPLCPGGADRAVTVENVEEFVELAHAYWCDDGVRAQLTAFREGLDEVIPVECFSAFSALELRDMICGEDSVEWGEQELLDHLRPSGGLTEHSPAYQHLVAVLLDMDQVNRSRFLDFVSSCPRFPPGGIDSFHVDVFPDSTAGRGFPRSRACANQLYLPLYRSKEELRERLHEAMHGSAGHHEQEQRILAS
ncbi:Ufd4 [Symbiodinium natans]|uniref:Ufd4 protein n=1 Tax=Symbiodinium natans TaxID=878477 RepID=A0A812RBW6_9DINO|nr:Ufd4 [Symbiodinium natans]